MVKLSVCIPSRNRQKYCIETIKSLAKSDVSSFEVIIGDNSDDPEPLATFFRTFDDKRFKLVPPGERIFSMVENWNRLIEYTSGEWVSIIGDDDYIDPNLAMLISGIQEVVPDADAVDWGAVHYTWPEIQKKEWRIPVPMGIGIHLHSQAEMLRRMFYWQGATDRPVCAYGIYHGVLKRELLETIKDTFGGKYFVHQIVDYESICKTILVAKQLVFCENPMSVHGACAASNSAATIHPSLMKSRNKVFLDEVKNSKDDLHHPSDFPFHEDLGITAVVASTILWVAQEYGLEVVGWEKNFVLACKNYCEAAVTAEEFNVRKSAYAEAIFVWKTGRYLKYFNPEFVDKAGNSHVFQGYHQEKLYVEPGISGVRTPGEAFEALQCVLPSVEFVLSQLEHLKKAA